MPGVIWDNPHAYNPSSELLIDLATLLFLNQHFSDHCLIKIETYIPVDPITILAKCINPTMTSFEKLDFNRSAWINLSQSEHRDLQMFNVPLKRPKADLNFKGNVEL